MTVPPTTWQPQNSNIHTETRQTTSTYAPPQMHKRRLWLNFKNQNWQHSNGIHARRKAEWEKQIVGYLPVNRHHINYSNYIECKCVEHCPYKAQYNIDGKKHSTWSKVTTILVCTSAKQNYVLQCLCSCICLQDSQYPKPFELSDKKDSCVNSHWIDWKFI